MPEGTAEEEQRRSLARRQRANPAEDEIVVTGAVHALHGPVQPGEGTVQSRVAGGAGRPGEAGEPVRPLPGEGSADALLPVGQHADSETAGRSDPGQVLELRSAQKPTSGGSSDTDVKELTARPCGAPPSIAATTTTPVANRPNAVRNAAGSTELSGMAVGSSDIRNPPGDRPSA